MKLFHWHSTALKAYTSGDIVVMAETMEQARELVLKNVMDWLMQDNSPKNFLVHMMGTEYWDEDDEAELETFLKLLKEDISKQPIDNKGVIFIEGGE
jgi:hypothetical protein